MIFDASSSHSSDSNQRSTTTAASFPEDHIKILMNLGATREDAIQLLQRANGNIDMAASMLFSHRAS
jgi:NACalpha-BTF3-like transcription factor